MRDPDCVRLALDRLFARVALYLVLWGSQVANAEAEQMQTEGLLLNFLRLGRGPGRGEGCGEVEGKYREGTRAATRGVQEAGSE